MSRPRPFVSARPWLSLLLACLVLYVPFLGKAFHIDDGVFIGLSGMIGWNPLRALTASGPYLGIQAHDVLPYESTHPPFLPWFLKLLRGAVGETETALHAGFLVFPLLALAGLDLLARTFGVRAPSRRVALLLLFVSAPPFLVNSHNLMADVPALAFLLLGTGLVVRSIEDGSKSDALSGSLSLTLAFFTAYQTAAILPLLSAYAFARGRMTWRIGGALLFPLAAMLVFFLEIHHTYGIVPLFRGRLASAGIDVIGDVRKGWGPGPVLGKLAFTLLTLVATLSPALVVRRLRSKEHVPLQVDGDRWATAFLLSWAGLFLVLGVVAFPFASARYLLPVLPPLFVILLRSRRTPTETGVTTGERWTVAASLAFGFLCAFVDARHASSYRELGAETATFRRTLPAGTDVWYIGEWGMRIYMDRAGARYLTRDSTEPRPGDFIVVPENPNLWNPSGIYRSRLRFFAAREFGLGLPLRLFSRRSHAGFYGHLWGLLPFSLSTAPLERFEIWQVTS